MAREVLWGWLTLDWRSSSNDLTLAKLSPSRRATSKMSSSETQPSGKSIPRCRSSALPTSMRNIESDSTRSASGTSMLPPPFPQLAPATGLQPMSSDPYTAQPAPELECSA